jgi:hypothetical protein
MGQRQPSPWCTSDGEHRRGVYQYQPRLQLSAQPLVSRRSNFIPNWQQFIIWDAQGGTVLGANLDFFIAPDENDNKHEIIRLKDSLATVPIPTTIGQGYQLQWALTYNGNDVTGCIFTVLTNTGATLGTVNFPVIGSPNFLTGTPLTAADTAPIMALQFSIGGEVGDGQGSIAPGAAEAITYTATNPLTVLTGIPSPVTHREGTGENANIIFGPLPSLAHTTVTQGFCATPAPTPGFGSGALAHCEALPLDLRMYPQQSQGMLFEALLSSLLSCIGLDELQMWRV